ncbi:XRE family transcriptional regulator [Rhodococcus ruber]|uniref:Putative transcriptional regulator n=1 Tax=Rhodococcus ruber TaxID=1830 RepID=A0A098BX61_9NOCA|nr:XRE family transcriptional regulator [Rhodococcus ruber]MCD2127697.1 XRE family transcriptional regulator [Rhodococcus ruber]MCZ4504355.1 XRE family transcriptional regulator [Rhodococcus ruber]MCZ4529409.1 XRE family transcriptional regulator [Rhodococcus ruber]MCZ4621016.1 XRE family transcriptional regulator [Rhodococcus ruber]MDI9967040.1 XRE family transcriptional regulator [Rhodococcus ruber]
MNHDPNLRLKQLRAKVGMTQGEFANALGVTQSLLSQVERNERRATPNVLESAVLRFNLAPDYFDVPPVHYNRQSLNFRRNVLTARAQDAAIYTFGDIEREVQQLLTGVPFRNIALDTRPRSTCLSLEEISEAAARTRSALALDPHTPIRNVTRAFERAGIGVVPFESDVVPEGKLDGISSPNDNGANFVIAIARRDSGDRIRFTVSHEGGHLVLHTRSRPDSEQVRETEANLFAGAFLLPEAPMRSDLSPDLTLLGYSKLKAKWGVSIQALIRRSLTLGVIDQNRYKSLMIQLSSRGWRTNEPVEVGFEEPRLVPHVTARPPAPAAPDRTGANVISLASRKRPPRD